MTARTASQAAGNISAGTGVPEVIARLRDELKRRGIDLFYFADGASARDYLLSRIPAGAMVMMSTCSSILTPLPASQ